MTIKLFYENPEIAEAAVQVVESGKDERGSYAVLDQTCFYPEGGGQPADQGQIGEAKVLDVQTVEGEVRHYTDISLDEAQYPASIDWQRRWDHTQQHAGQHVLSAVFDDDFGMKTQSFHLGETRVSIDLDAAETSEQQLRSAEAKANAIIRKHLPVTTEWVDEQQAAEMALRKPPAVKGPIRLVKIEGVDLNACGGTHPKNTADIGLIKIISSEKAKGGTRIYFLCGERAMAHFQFLIETGDQLVHKLNAPVTDLPLAAEALLEEKAANDKEMKELRQNLLGFEAQTIKEEDGRIEKVYSNRPFKEVQQLAKRVIADHPYAVLLFLTTDGSSVRFVCAKGSEREGDMKRALSALLELTDGKGGGNPQFAQGGGQSVEEPGKFIRVFRETVKNIQ